MRVIAVSQFGSFLFFVPWRSFQENVDLIKLVVTEKPVKVRVVGKNFVDVGDSGFDRFSKSLFVTMPIAGFTNQFYHFGIAFRRSGHSA